MINKKLFKVIVWVMIIAMLFSTILFTVELFVG